MSLDVTLVMMDDEVEDTPDNIPGYSVFEDNITHNLNKMAQAAGIYEVVWRPEKIHIEVAAELVVPLEQGLRLLRENPERFKVYNPANGWGSYDGFVRFIERYLRACRSHPSARVVVSR